VLVAPCSKLKTPQKGFSMSDKTTEKKLKTPQKGFSMSDKTTEKKLKCKYPVGFFSGITLDNKKIIAGTLCCNSWTCPACQEKLKKKLFKRILQGSMSKEAVSRYGMKFLTLTYPGRLYRENKEPAEMYNEMAVAFHKMIRALKKRYGNFHYFRVCEPQKDRTPHFHVMLVGNNIIPKSILESVENLWRSKYCMGFVRINAVKFNNNKHAINYMLKYITKDIVKPGKYKRIFTASRNSLLKKHNMEWSRMKLCIGRTTDNGIQEYKLDLNPENEFQLWGHTHVDAGTAYGGAFYIEKQAWIDKLFNIAYTQAGLITN
jgi:hypothetical protein